MHIVHKKKGTNLWEVAWMWMPHFLAADLGLVKRVDEVMNEEFASGLRSDTSIEAMHNRVLSVILERYPIKGLELYLHALIQVEPEEKA